jgi:hypothetical protein
MSDTFVDQPSGLDTGAPAPTPTDAGTPAPTQTPAEYEVKVNGQSMKVPLDELIKGYQRQSHYTREMQALAAQREQLGMIPKYQAALREAQSFLGDEGRIATYYQQKFGKQLTAATEAAQDQVDAGYLTPAQAQQMLTSMRQELQQELAEERLVHKQANTCLEELG